VVGGRRRGGSSWRSVDVAFAMAAMACSTAASVLVDGDVTPLTFRTYWRAADSISSWVAAGSRPRNVVMFRHMTRQ
jgi:hypothetical protein